MLPGDVGRSILGPLADQRAVDALNEQLGTNEPLITQYFDWIGGLLTGDMGNSLAFRRPVSDVLGDALVNSLKLAILAFIIVVPLSILGGVFAALNEGSKRDRFISLGGLSATAVPDFVWAVLLILVFSLAASGSSRPPPPRRRGSSFFDAGLLPDPARVLPRLRAVRLHRADGARGHDRGARRRLHADGDHQGPAAPHGRARATCCATRCCRRSRWSPPRSGYLLGGLVVIEMIFNYQGIGQALFRAATQKDFPLLETGVLVVGVVYLVATLIADIALLGPQPARALGGDEQ